MTSPPSLSASSPRAASAFVGVRLGFSTGARRLLSREVMLTSLLAFALALTAGIIERRVTTAGAVDRSLAATFRVVVPLYCFAIAARVSERDSLREATWSVARHGAARRDVALGMAAALGIGVSLAGVLLAAVAVVSAHSPSSAPLARDVWTSGWIGGLVAAAYAGWFALGSTFFTRGRGRWMPLVVDFVVGSGGGLVAALLPRAHARGLLGADGPLGLSQPASSASLLLMAIVLPVLAALRCRD